MQRLYKQVPGLCALSDLKIQGVPTIPLRYGWPNWWAKMEIFRPDIPGDVYYFDLDTLVLNWIPRPKADTVLTDFGDKKVIGSGLMYLTEKTRAKIWADWIKNPEEHMAKHVKWPAGDQGYLLSHLRNAQRWQNIANVYSWKIHCKKGIPEDADVVCFHGKPRPWEVGY